MSAHVTNHAGDCVPTCPACYAMTGTKPPVTSNSSNELPEGHWRLFSYDHLVQECMSLSRALNDNSLDSDSGIARMLLERVLVEMRLLVAKNVRLQRDIEAFLSTGAAPETSELSRALHTIDEAGKLSDWINRARPAITDLMQAYERRIRTDCTPEQLVKEPWRCMEYIGAEALLRDQPVAVVEIWPRGELKADEPPCCGKCQGWHHPLTNCSPVGKEGGQ